MKGTEAVLRNCKGHLEGPYWQDKGAKCMDWIVEADKKIDIPADAFMERCAKNR